MSQFKFSVTDWGGLADGQYLVMVGESTATLAYRRYEVGRWGAPVFPVEVNLDSVTGEADAQAVANVKEVLAWLESVPVGPISVAVVAARLEQALGVKGGVVNIVIAVTIEWDREEWEEAIFESGCLSYPWWHRLERHGATVLAGEPVWKVTWIDPDDASDSPDSGQAYFTAHDMAVNAGRLAAESPALARSLTDHDLDADAADAILQQTVFGEVIYG